MSKSYSDTWLRVWREEAGISQGELAKRAGLSKVTINHLERGHKEPSSATAQRITAVLAQELDFDISIYDVFPDPDVRSPREVALTYSRVMREHREAKDAIDAEPDVVPEDEYERDMAWLESEQAKRGRDRYYRRQDPHTYEPMTLMLADGRVIVEQPPAWFRGRAREPRSRRSGARRTRRITKSSPSDDPGPGEGEPAGGRQPHDVKNSAGVVAAESGRRSPTILPTAGLERGARRLEPARPAARPTGGRA